MARGMNAAPTTMFGAGLELTGISVKVIASWLGPVIASVWFWAALIALPRSGDRLGPFPSPLTLLVRFLQWGGWSVEAVATTAEWFHARPSLAVVFGCLAMVGIAARNNLLHFLPLLAGIEAGGVWATLGSHFLLSAAFALVGAAIKDDEGRFFTGISIAMERWTTLVLGPLVTAAIMPLGLAYALAEPFSLAGTAAGGRGRVRAVDEFMMEQIPDRETKLSDLDARTASRLLSVVLASIRDDDRAGGLFGWRFSFGNTADDRLRHRRSDGES